MGVSQVLAALSSIIIARVLGKETFGEFGMVRNTIMMLGTLAGLGLGLTTNKFVAEFRDSDPPAGKPGAGIDPDVGCHFGNVGLSLGGNGRGLPRAANPERGATCLYIRICAPLLLMSVVNGVQMAAISGMEQFRVLAWLTAVTVLTVAVGSALGAAGWGIQGALCGTVLGAFINVLVLEAVGAPLRRRRGVPVAFRGVWQERRIIFSFAVPSISGLMVGPITWAALRLLFIRPDGPGQTALFNAATQIRALALFVPGAIAQVVMPMFSNLQAGLDAGTIQRAVRLSSLASLAAGLAVALPLIVASRQIMGLFGPGFSSGWVVLSLLCLAAVLQATNTVIGGPGSSEQDVVGVSAQLSLGSRVPGGVLASRPPWGHRTGLGLFVIVRAAHHPGLGIRPLCHTAPPGVESHPGSSAGGGWRVGMTTDSVMYRLAVHSGRLPSILGELGRRIGRHHGVLLNCGYRMIIHDPREYIQRCVLAYGAYEPGIAGVLAAILRPGEVFFDVGANIGHHSLVAASRGARVHAFEPVPRLAERLRENFRFNGIEDRLVVNVAAVGADPGAAVLYEADRPDDGSHSIIPGVPAAAHHPHQVKVVARRLRRQ